METQNLVNSVSGDILLPDNEDYDAARSVWNVRFNSKPKIIVRCLTSSDVQAAVNFALKEGLGIGVKGGGHGFAGNTVTDGGILLDLSPMRNIDIDLHEKTVRVEPGLNWGDVFAVTQPHGLAAVGGTVSTVGVAGLTLGGGSGYLSRKFGMAVDNLIAAEVVTAAGSIVTASESENEDLFWGLRGGGGNFGVVTEFAMKLHEVGPQIMAGQIVHPFSDAENVLRLYRDFMRSAADEIQVYPFILRIPAIPEFPVQYHGQLAIDLVVFHCKPGTQDAFKALLNYGEPILSFAIDQPMCEWLQTFNAGLPAGQRYDSLADTLLDLSDAAISEFIQQVASMPGEYTMAYLDNASAAVTRVNPASTAYPHRNPAVNYHIVAGWADREKDEKVTRWLREFGQAMNPYCTGSVYVNLLGGDEQDRVVASYRDNYPRLVQLKKKWDPDNVFRANHNIEPAGH